MGHPVDKKKDLREMLRDMTNQQKQMSMEMAYVARVFKKSNEYERLDSTIKQIDLEPTSP